MEISTYLASTIFPSSLDIAVGKCYVTISSCGAHGVRSDWTGGQGGDFWLVLLLTLQFLVELADGNDDPLDVFAVV
jgi:hypothetical protein